MKYLPVNWKDGMKITKVHFQQTENSWQDHLHHSTKAYINGHNFGLLPHENELNVMVDDQIVNLTVCHAITRGGIRIDFTDQEVGALKKSIQSLKSNQELQNGTEWLVVLTINPFKRMPYGVIDPEEAPHRHPSTLPKYDLEIVSINDLHERHFSEFAIPIAKIDSKYQGIKKDDDYIPPCTCLNSYPLLLSKHEKHKRLLNSIEDNLFEIIRKIYRKKEQNTSNRLSNNLLLLSKELSSYITTNFDSLRLIAPQEAPIYMVTWFVGMARTLDSSLRLLKDKEILVEYFKKVYLDNSFPFEKNIGELKMAEYNHLDIQPTLVKIKAFLEVLDQLFARLKDLDWVELGDESIIVRNTFSSQTRTTVNPHRSSPPPPPKTGGIRIRNAGSKKSEGRGEEPNKGWNLED